MEYGSRLSFCRPRCDTTSFHIFLKVKMLRVRSRAGGGLCLQRAFRQSSANCSFTTTFSHVICFRSPVFVSSKKMTACWWAATGRCTCSLRILNISPVLKNVLKPTRIMWATSGHLHCIKVPAIANINSGVAGVALKGSSTRFQVDTKRHAPARRCRHSGK